MTTTAVPAAGAPTYGRLLRTRGVPALFGLSLAGILGTSLQILALSVSVYERTGSPLWSSTAFAAGFLPQLVGGSVLTSLADRWPVRPVLAAGAVVRALSALALATGHLAPWQAITLVAAVAVVQPVPSAAQSATVARLLTGETYVLGRSVFNLISSGAQLLGLAVGGATVALVGTSAAFGIAAGIQVTGLLAVAAIPPVRHIEIPSTRWTPRETWTGNVELFRVPAVRRLLLSWWVPLTLLVAAESLVVAYVGEQGRSATPTGWLMAAFPAGAAVGDFVVGRWLTQNQRESSVPWLFVLVGIALLPLALDPVPAVAGVCFLAASAGMAYQLGGQNAYLGAVPEARRGLAFGLVGTGTMAGQGIGPLAAGWLADVGGAGHAIGAAGAGVLVAALFLARRPAPAAAVVGANTETAAPRP